jgi:hypothetical protein
LARRALYNGILRAQPLSFGCSDSANGTTAFKVFLFTALLEVSFNLY